MKNCHLDYHYHLICRLWYHLMKSSVWRLKGVSLFAKVVFPLAVGWEVLIPKRDFSGDSVCGSIRHPHPSRGLRVGDTYSFTPWHLTCPCNLLWPLDYYQTWYGQKWEAWLCLCHQGASSSRLDPQMRQVLQPAVKPTADPWARKINKCIDSYWNVGTTCYAALFWY